MTVMTPYGAIGWERVKVQCNTITNVMGSLSSLGILLLLVKVHVQLAITVPVS